MGALKIHSFKFYPEAQTAKESELSDDERSPHPNLATLPNPCNTAQTAALEDLNAI